MKAPGLLFLALYEKVPSLVGADVVTDIKINMETIFKKIESLKHQAEFQDLRGLKCRNQNPLFTVPSH
jgi:hypothetical protein